MGARFEEQIVPQSSAGLTPVHFDLFPSLLSSPSFFEIYILYSTTNSFATSFTGHNVYSVYGFDSHNNRICIIYIILPGAMPQLAVLKLFGLWQEKENVSLQPQSAILPPDNMIMQSSLLFSLLGSSCAHETGIADRGTPVIYLKNYHLDGVWFTE